MTKRLSLLVFGPHLDTGSICSSPSAPTLICLYIRSPSTAKALGGLGLFHGEKQPPDKLPTRERVTSESSHHIQVYAFLKYNSLLFPLSLRNAFSTFSFQNYFSTSTFRHLLGGNLYHHLPEPLSCSNVASSRVLHSRVKAATMRGKTPVTVCWNLSCIRGTFHGIMAS